MNWTHTLDWDDAEIDELVAMARRLQANPRDLLGCWMSESGARSSARLPADTAKPAIAVGLIQWTKAGAPPGAVLDEIRARPLLAQLALAEAFYSGHRGELDSPGAVYLCNWLPALMKHHNELTFVLAGRHGPHEDWYRWNASLDANDDGAITVQDLTEKIARAQHGPRWDEFAERIRLAEQDIDTSPELPEVDGDGTLSETFPANDDGEHDNGPPDDVA